MCAKLIEINSLIIKNKLVLGKDENRDTLIVDERRLRALLSSLLKGIEGYIILEGHHVSRIVPKKIRLAFVLRCNPHELTERLHRRGYKTSKIRENVEAEILDVCLVEAIDWFGEDVVCEIDTTGRSVAQVVDEAWSILFEGKCSMLGRTNWLSHMEWEGVVSSLLEDEGKWTRRST